jgi:hypothetical protein
MPIPADKDIPFADFFVEQTPLESVEIRELPLENPIRKLHACYELAPAHAGESMPPYLQDFLEAVPGDLMDYCLILLPATGEPFINFQVLHRGKKIPGSNLASFKDGERYTDHVLPEFRDERLLELASCLALRRCRFSFTRSARRSSQHVNVFRAVLPVWLAEHHLHGVVLAVAPAAIGQDR